MKGDIPYVPSPILATFSYELTSIQFPLSSRSSSFLISLLLDVDSDIDIDIDAIVETSGFKLCFVTKFKKEMAGAWGKGSRTTRGDEMMRLMIL